MGRADLHLHTDLSDGLSTVEETLEHVERETRLDVIAITDHDDVRAGLAARELAAQRGYRFEVVVGVEISTRAGHLLALFLEVPVPSFHPLEWTVDTVHERGGICIVPHPLSWLIHSVGRRGFDRIMARPNPTDRFDAIETSPATPAAAVTHWRARHLNANRYHLPETGGSDSHFLQTIGRGYTLFEGHTAADLRQSLANRTTRSHLDPTRSLANVPGRDLLRQQARSLLWLPARRIAARIGREATP